MRDGVKMVEAAFAQTKRTKQGSVSEVDSKVETFPAALFDALRKKGKVPGGKKSASLTGKGSRVVWSGDPHGRTWEVLGPASNGRVEIGLKSRAERGVRHYRILRLAKPESLTPATLGGKAKKSASYTKTEKLPPTMRRINEHFQFGGSKHGLATKGDYIYIVRDRAKPATGDNVIKGWPNKKSFDASLTKDRTVEGWVKEHVDRKYYSETLGKKDFPKKSEITAASKKIAVSEKVASRVASTGSINKILEKSGTNIRLRRGPEGYYYWEGAPPTMESIYSNNLRGYKLGEILDVFNEGIE
jgi:hypothetical protein